MPFENINNLKITIKYLLKFWFGNWTIDRSKIVVSMQITIIILQRTKILERLKFIFNGLKFLFKVFKVFFRVVKFFFSRVVNKLY